MKMSSVAVWARRGRRWLAAIALLQSAAAAPVRWERLASLPAGNGGFAGAALGGEIIVAGGTTWRGETKRWLDQIWAYDPAHNVWREAGRLPAPIAYAVTGQTAAQAWIAGGTNGESTHRLLWRLEQGPALKLLAPLEHGFVYAAGAVIGATLYAVGGTNDQAALDRATNRFRAIDLRSGAITRLSDYPEASLTTATAAAVNGRLFVFGGARWDAVKKSVVNHATAHVYSPTTQRWEALPQLPHPGRGLTAVALDGRHILIAGGYRNDTVEFVADAFVFDVETRLYAPAAPLPYAGMVGLVKSGEWLYCLGGEDRKKHRTDAVFRTRWTDLLTK
jgi:N-acetylneuraminic acid mutarotase